MRHNGRRRETTGTAGGGRRGRRRTRRKNRRRNTGRKIKAFRQMKGKRSRNKVWGPEPGSPPFLCVCVGVCVAGVWVLTLSAVTGEGGSAPEDAAPTAQRDGRNSCHGLVASQSDAPDNHQPIRDVGPTGRSGHVPEKSRSTAS